MLRFPVLLCVCVFASTLAASEPSDAATIKIAELNHQLAELSRRVDAIERAIAKTTEERVAIEFDRLRVPYGDATFRDRAHAEIAEKGRKTYLSGVFSSDIGWEQVSVENASKIEPFFLRSAASRIPVGRLSKIIDDGNALYLLRVTSRSR